jgi:hypothetical protein
MGCPLESSLCRDTSSEIALHYVVAARPSNTTNPLPAVCRYETIIFIVPPVVAPLLGAVYVRSYGRRSGIMLGCCIMLVGQVRPAHCAEL